MWEIAVSRPGPPGPRSGPAPSGMAPPLYEGIKLPRKLYNDLSAKRRRDKRQAERQEKLLPALARKHSSAQTRLQASLRREAALKAKLAKTRKEHKTAQKEAATHKRRACDLKFLADSAQEAFRETMQDLQDAHKQSGKRLLEKKEVEKELARTGKEAAKTLEKEAAKTGQLLKKLRRAEDDNAKLTTRVEASEESLADATADRRAYRNILSWVTRKEDWGLWYKLERWAKRAPPFDTTNG